MQWIHTEDHTTIIPKDFYKFKIKKFTKKTCWFCDCYPFCWVCRNCKEHCTCVKLKAVK